MSLLEIIGCIIFGSAFILGTIAIIIQKIKTGKSWKGQGYGN